MRGQRNGSRLRAVARDEKCCHFIYRDLISVASMAGVVSAGMRMDRAERWVAAADAHIACTARHCLRRPLLLHLALLR